MYDLRDADETFAAEWDEAIEAGCDVLEDALRVAATEGWDEETFDGDDVLIRRTRRRDPRLNERLLAARRPDRWRQGSRLEVTGGGGGPIELEGRPVVGLADVVALAHKLGAAHLFGLPDVVEGEAVELGVLEADPQGRALGVPVRQTALA